MRKIDPLFHGRSPLDRLFEQRQGFINAPGQGICMAQDRGDTGNRRPDVGGPAESKGTFEQGERLVEVPFQEG